MRSSLLIIAAAIAALGTAACGRGEARENRSAGPDASRDYTVAAFDRIAVAGPYEVTVATGGQPSVKASGGQNMLDDMVVEVVDGTLKIHPVKKKGIRWSWSSDGTVKLTVTVPALREAAIAGSGGISIDRVTGDSFEGDIAGSGDLRLAAVDTGSLKFSIAGSGEVTAVGKAKSVDYSIAGSGDIDAKGLVAETAEVSIAGSGNVAANATGTATVSIMGSGDVAMSGGAKCDVSKHGSGNVTCS